MPKTPEGFSIKGEVEKFDRAKREITMLAMSPEMWEEVEAGKMAEIKKAALQEIEKALLEEDYGRAGGLTRALYRFFGKEEINARAESPKIKPDKKEKEAERDSRAVRELRELITEYDWDKSVGYLKYISDWPNYVIRTAAGMRALFGEKFLKDVTVSERTKEKIFAEARDAKKHVCVYCLGILDNARPFLSSEMEQKVRLSEDDWSRLSGDIHPRIQSGNVERLAMAMAYDPKEFAKKFRPDDTFWKKVRERIDSFKSGYPEYYVYAAASAQRVKDTLGYADVPDFTVPEDIWQKAKSELAGGIRNGMPPSMYWHYLDVFRHAKLEEK